MLNLKKYRGFAIPLAIGIIIFLGLLIISFSSFTSSQRRLIHKSFQKEITLHLTENISRMLTAYINKRILDTTGLDNLIYKDLVFNSIPTSGISSLTLSELDTHMPGLTDYAKQFGIIIDDFVIKYTDVIPISQPFPMIKNDPVEKYGKIQIHLKARYQKTRVRLDMEKEFRVVNLIPPVVSKFTLFVRNNMNDTDVNCIKNDEQTGKVTGDKKPLICYNAGVVAELESASLQKKGWIFLGESSWFLNIASGNEQNPIFDKFGQDFLLMPWLTYTKKEKCPNDEHDIKIFQQGFFDGVKTGPNMASLDPTFNADSNALHLFGDRENKSPTLVIGDVRPRSLMYGSLTWHTPPSYAGTLNHYSLNYRENQTEFLSNPKTIDHDTPPTTNTNHCHDHDIIDSPDNPTSTPITCPGGAVTSPSGDCTVFQYVGSPDSANEYIHYMSRVINGNRPYESWAVHYNQAYDRIKNSGLTTLFDIPLGALDLLGTDNIGTFVTFGTMASALFPVGIEKTFFYNCNAYSNLLINGMVKIMNDAGDELFDGALYQLNSIIRPEKFTNVIDLDNGVTSSSTSSLPIPERTFDILFVDRNTPTWSMHLNSILYCNTSKNSFTINNRKLDVIRGGMIICEKDIIIGGEISNSTSNEPLTIISTEGDIIIQTDKPIRASLIALKGSLRKTGNRPLSIFGNVAVKEIDPSVFDVIMKRTSSCPIHNSVCSESYIIYDYMLNQIDSTHYKNTYRVFLSPRNIFVKISSY